MRVCISSHLVTDAIVYGIDVENSILASIGNLFSWIFYPIVGTNSWAVAVSAVQGLVAKEQVISSMAVIAGLAEEVTEGALIFSSTGIFGFFNPASAYAFMIFNLFSAPCFGAIGAMHRVSSSVVKNPNFGFLPARLDEKGYFTMLANDNGSMMRVNCNKQGIQVKIVNQKDEVLLDRLFK